MLTRTIGDTPGLATPVSAPESESARVVSASRIEEQGIADNLECAASAVCNQEGVINCKVFATLRAQLAMRGYSLSRTDAGDGPVRFHASRWGLIVELRDLAAVEAFAERAGVNHG